MQKNLEKKLDTFKTIIFDELQNKKRTKRDAYDREEEENLKEQSQLLKKNADTFRRTRTAKTKMTVDQMLSETKMTKNSEARALKKQILEETIEALYQKTEAFLNTDRYREYILNELDQLKDHIAKNESCTLYTRGDDRDWVERQLGILGVTDVDWMALAKRQLGGVIVEFPDRHIRYNLTLKNAIDEKGDHIGGVLYELLERMEG